MKTQVTETHERVIVARLDRHELIALVAGHIVASHNLDPSHKSVTCRVEFPEETAGSPSYTVGIGAKVTITVQLGTPE